MASSRYKEDSCNIFFSIHISILVYCTHENNPDLKLTDISREGETPLIPSYPRPGIVEPFTVRIFRKIVGTTDNKGNHSDTFYF
jgi:hypothetical protein